MGLISQESYYAPFGLNLTGIQKSGIPDNKFQYNGIEKQEEFGLNWNQAFYRGYDSQLGRWHQIDPKIEALESLTPYNFCLNNPVLHSDPDGDLPPVVWGAIIGGVVSGGIAAWEGKDAKGVLTAALSGAVSGALVASGAGLVQKLALDAGGAAILNGATGYVAGGTQELINQVGEKLSGDRSEFDTGKMVRSAATGAVSNAAAGIISDKIVNHFTNKAATQVATNTTLRTTGKQAQEQIRKDLLKNPALKNNNPKLQQALVKELQQRKAEAQTAGEAAGKTAKVLTQVVVESVSQVGTNQINNKLNEQNKSKR